MPVLEKRVSKLEEVFERFVYEMQEFKDEMRNDMREFKEEMRLWREKTDRIIQQLIEDRKKAEERWEREKKERDEKWEREKKERDEKWEREKAEMNKRWGELANKMGTIVEDIVAPNIPTVAKKYFGIEKPLFFAIRVEKMNLKTHQIKEFDVILVGKDSVILNETKSTVRIDYVTRFIHFIKKGTFFEYFPEYQGKKIIPIFSSLRIKQEVVDRLTKNHIYAMAMKGDSMDILNPELKIEEK